MQNNNKKHVYIGRMRLRLKQQKEKRKKKSLKAWLNADGSTLILNQPVQVCVQRSC
jgi:hypothetical protein